MLAPSDTLLVRADAGVRMGTGHVMRCLGLAQAWQDRGGRVVYVMAQASPGLDDRLAGEEIDVRMLSEEPGSASDAVATAAIAQGTCDSDWVVVDGYHFDSDYHKILKGSGLHVLALDDFGALPHYWADIVLNQDPIAEEHMYAKRESYVQLLLGTQYTFLRREFRRHARPQRETPPVARKILITLGGSDPDNVTEKVIHSVNAVRVENLEATVLIGPSNPHGERLEAAAAQSNVHIRLLHNPPDIPAEMAACDMAITAGGSTVWELAYCRVPSMVLLVADNQDPAMGLLDARGACWRLGDGRTLSVDELSAAISAMCRDREKRASLGKILGETSDGQGAERVCDAICRIRRTCGSEALPA